MRRLIVVAGVAAATWTGFVAGYHLGRNDQWTAGIRAEQRRRTMGGAPRFER